MERVQRHARLLAFGVLLVVTAYGAWEFATGDWGAAVEYWRERIHVFPLVLAFAAVDIALEGFAWMWVYRLSGIGAFDRRGAAAFLSGRAGWLLPAQLGRLIRPDAMARLGRAPLKECMKAEAVTFALDVTSVGALVAGLLAWRVHPLLAPVVAVASAYVALRLGNRIADFLTGTHLELPPDIWLRKSTLGVVCVQAAGWVAHGVALWVLIRGLTDGGALWSSIFYSATSAVIGVGSGLPGGLGATEGLLGASLRLMHVPPEHLALAVGGFRAATFWIWLAVGWAALAWINRIAGRRRAEEPPAPACAAEPQAARR